MEYYELIYHELVLDPNSKDRFNDIVYARCKTKEELDELINRYSISIISGGYERYEEGFIIKKYNIAPFINEKMIAFRAAFNKKYFEDIWNILLNYPIKKNINIKKESKKNQWKFVISIRTLSQECSYLIYAQHEQNLL